MPIVACVFACGAAAAGPLEWQVDITPGGELFPVLDLSQTPAATNGAVGGGSGLVAIRVSSDARRDLHLRVETEGLRAEATVDATIERANTIVELRPRLDWDRAYLRGLTAPRTQILRVTLESPGLGVERRDVSVRLHPLDDALYYVREGSERVDLSWVFAAYVDPHDAVVDEVLAIARADSVDIDRPARTAADRVHQVRAVWSALETRGLRYASGDPTLSRGPSIYSQRVRLLSDSWEQRRVNCIDSSVLIASVLERLGIPGFIVLVPQHAFVGFYTADDRQLPEFLETTVLGSGDEAHTTQTGPDGFAAARAAGRARWARVASKFNGKHRPDFEWIDIPTARANGTLPIGRDEYADP